MLAFDWSSETSEMKSFQLNMRTDNCFEYVNNMLLSDVSDVGYCVVPVIIRTQLKDVSATFWPDNKSRKAFETRNFSLLGVPLL